MQAGEGVSVEVPEAETKKKGALKVTVKDTCDGKGVKDVEVTVKGNTKKTNGDGEATFSDLSLGPTRIKVKIHFKDADYSKFIVQYPRILNSHEAKSAENDLVDIIDGTESESNINIVVFKLIDTIVFHRKHIDLGGRDKYGHWWVKIDGNISYGWWPKYPMGSDKNRTSQPPKQPKPLPANAGRMQRIQYGFDSAVYSAKAKAYEMKESSVGQTFRGVEGELNGQTSFGGTKTRDPHHSDSGDEQYSPVRNDCFDYSTILGNMSNFAQNYSGGWSWRFEAGNHCHTFQKTLMKQCKLTKVKVLK